MQIYSSRVFGKRLKLNIIFNSLIFSRNLEVMCQSRKVQETSINASVAMHYAICGCYMFRRRLRQILNPDHNRSSFSSSLCRLDGHLLWPLPAHHETSIHSFFGCFLLIYRF